MLCGAQASSCDSREKAQLYLFNFSLSSLSLPLALSLSRSFTSLLSEHRGPGAVPCSPSNNGMQTAGQRNPGLTLTAELSIQEGGRRNTISQREGGVWLIMRDHVQFHPLENRGSERGKQMGLERNRRVTSLEEEMTKV